MGAKNEGLVYLKHYQLPKIQNLDNFMVMKHRGMFFLY